MSFVIGGIKGTAGEPILRTFSGQTMRYRTAAYM
jgi:hypothetical protein